MEIIKEVKIRFRHDFLFSAHLSRLSNGTFRIYYIDKHAKAIQRERQLLTKKKIVLFLSFQARTFLAMNRMMFDEVFLYYQIQIVWKMSMIVKNTQNLSFLSKDNVRLKHNKYIKISTLDLTPFIHEQFGFIDPDFPHVASSISPNEQSENQDLQWLPSQNKHEYANYSDLITNLQINLFHHKSIGYALTIINWFANVYFADIFMQELSAYHLYCYDVMIDGVFMNIPIDSYVPIDSGTRTQLFSKNYKGSIFPCLYEKLLAKIYGDYQSITADFLDIVELQTLFCRQEISLTMGIQQTFLIETIKASLQQKSIVSFKTRNSIKLESFGLQSNSIYIILRLIPKDESYLVQFLQLSGQRWMGKYSKLRSQWLIQQALILQHKIMTQSQYKENYMLLSDMKGLGRQLTILHNTLSDHKNYYSCQNSEYNISGYTFTLKDRNKVKIRVNYRHKKCYNSIFIIGRLVQGQKLICSSFNENKDYNFQELELEQGDYTVIIYNTHPHESTLPYNITIFSSVQYIELLSINSISELLGIFQVVFKNHFIHKYRTSKEPVIFKQLYNDTGLSFIFINRPSYRLSLKINTALLKDNKIFFVNQSHVGKDHEFILQYEKDEYSLVILKCLWSKKQNINFDYASNGSKQHIQKIVFPPLGSIKAFKRLDTITI